LPPRWPCGARSAIRCNWPYRVARKQAGEELAVAPPVEALNKPDDAAGDVDELNGFFRRYALAA
jgi:hypothetical protein